MSIFPGVYEHYKGKRYDVVGVATHTETQEVFVVYCPLYNDEGLKIRPLEMFEQDVLVDGVTMPRFRKIELNDA